MAGLFGYLAAGAAEGVGSSMKEQAIAKREAALENLRIEREMAFRRGEREADQSFRSSEAAIGREHDSRENALTREASGAVETLEDGTSVVRRGTTYEQVKGPDGKPARLLGNAKDDPATVAEMKYLIQAGVAKDAKDAYRKVKAATGNDNARAKLEIDLYKTLKEDISDRRSDQEKREAAREQLDEIIARQQAIDNGDAPATESEGETTEPAPMERPKGMSDEEIISQAQEALANGKDKTAIRSRLRQLGIDPAKAGI